VAKAPKKYLPRDIRWMNDAHDRMRRIGRATMAARPSDDGGPAQRVSAPSSSSAAPSASRFKRWYGDTLEHLLLGAVGQSDP